MRSRIEALKGQKNAVVLAHFYQTMDVQECADFVGDSFDLSKKARDAREDTIVFCGVHFMAESAKILSPEKKVLLPSPDAGCPMADMVTPEDVRALRQAYPDAAVCCYVNSSAAVKAESDICCTSSSAVRIVSALEQRRVIFIPDKNLGAYVARMVPGKEIILFDGWCPVHHQTKAEDIAAAKEAHPGALVLSHPECPLAVLDMSDFVGSTKEILDFVQKSGGDEFIIATEIGVVERIRAMNPEKLVYVAHNRFICPNMKKTRLSDLLFSLENDYYEINLPQHELEGARACLERMVSAG